MDKRKLQRMQAALDGELSPEEEQKHSLALETDSDYAGKYDRLHKTEALLRTAPRERAPERLALTIMARLAEAVSPQMQEASPITEEMVQAAIQLVTVATLPMLVGAGWMLLNAQSDPEMLEVVLLRVAALFILVLDVTQVIFEEAALLFDTDPKRAIALLSMLPVILLALVEQVMVIDDADLME